MALQGHVASASAQPPRPGTPASLGSRSTPAAQPAAGLTTRNLQHLERQQAPRSNLPAEKKGLSSSAEAIKWLAAEPSLHQQRQRTTAVHGY